MKTLEDMSIKDLQAVYSILGDRWSYYDSQINEYREKEDSDDCDEEIRLTTSFLVGERSGIGEAMLIMRQKITTSLAERTARKLFPDNRHP